MTIRSDVGFKESFRPDRWRRAATLARLLSWSFAMALAEPAGASQLLVPGIGVPDAGMNGATVGSPRTPSAAAFSNPGAATSFESGAASLSIGLPVGRSNVTATTPAGYDTDSNFLAIAPESGAVFKTESGLTWGVSLYGSLGSTFNSNADPAVGVDNDFYSSLAISNLALLVAYPINEKLSVGATLTGMYGQSHLRYFQTIPFAYTVRGPGLQAMFGVQYRPIERVSLGVGFRTPGMVWATGDTPLPDGGKQDVKIDLDMPAQIFLGANVDVTEKLEIGLSGRWTDASTFSDSNFRFEDTPQANIPFIQSASDEWRISAGAEYSWLESLRTSFGVGYADEIVPDTWVSPLLIDTAEWKITAGFAWDLPGRLSGWTLDFSVGHSPTGVRNIPDSQAVVFPGRYAIGGEIYLIGLRTNLGS